MGLKGLLSVCLYAYNNYYVVCKTPTIIIIIYHA